jgi:hypothetical protein
MIRGTLVSGLLLLTPTAAQADCVAACMRDAPLASQDHFVRADAVRRCRDGCEREMRGKIASSGLDERLRSCERRDLTLPEFRQLRGANPSWQQQFNIFTWQVTNRFEDLVLTGLEVTTQDLNLSTVTLSAAALIPPGETGTFVIPDFFDGYPAVRYATKVERVTACALPPAP